MCHLSLWCTIGFLRVVRAHQFFLYADNGVSVLIVILIVNVDSPGKDTIFDLADHSKSSDLQKKWKSAKSPMNCKHYKKAESLDKQSYINQIWRQAASL